MPSKVEFLIFSSPQQFLFRMVRIWGRKGKEVK